ncbi:MAG: diacylglycerol kinase family protein [Thermomicrobiales bacterium]
MPSSRALAIINPATGRLTTSSVEAHLLREASRRNITLRIERTTRPGHAVELAAGAVDEVDTILAVGGDGTVSDVVTGALGSALTVGIIPIGSTNIIARELDIPRKIDRAAAIAFGDGVDVLIDVAQAGTTTFMHMAGAGFDAAIMRHTPSGWKRKVGWLAYLPAAARHLNAPRFATLLTIDGAQYPTTARLVLCAIGGAIVHPRFRIGDEIDRTDGVLDILVYDPPGIIGTLSCLGWIVAGHPGRSRWLVQRTGRSLRIEADQLVPFEVDGDFIGYLPVDIRMLEHQARVRVPHSAQISRGRS